MSVLEASYRPMGDDVLRTRWMLSFGHRPNAGQTFDALIDAYREPGRYYHTIEHAFEVAVSVEALSDDLPPLDAEIVGLAAWTHDAHYDPERQDNEEQSAELAVGFAAQLGFAADQREELHALILVSNHRTTPTTPLQATLCDADLAVLAKPWQGYCNDVQNIRCELGIESDAEWAAMRLMILDFFQNKKPLYHQPKSVERWGAAASANFAQELRSLPPQH